MSANQRFTQKEKLLILGLAIVVIVLAVFSFLLLKANQKLEAKSKIMLQALTLSNHLNQNTASAYKVFGECVTHPDICNKEEVEKKLKELETEKEQINSQIQSITDNLKNM